MKYFFEELFVDKEKDGDLISEIRESVDEDIDAFKDDIEIATAASIGQQTLSSARRLPSDGEHRRGRRNVTMILLKVKIDDTVLDCLSLTVHKLL